MFVLQLTHSIIPAKVGKDDLKSIANTKQTVYSAFENRFLSTHVPYRYGGLPLDKGSRYALLEANQQLFDFLVKVDYSAARVADKGQASANNSLEAENQRSRMTLENKNSGFVAEKMRLLGPLLAQLGLPPNIPNTDSSDVIWKLKRAASLALKEVVRLLGLSSVPNLFRAPDSHKIKGGVYSLDAFHKARKLLSDHFNKYYPQACEMFLLGSFVYKHPPDSPPSDIDFRILIPSLQREHYTAHIRFAHNLLTDPILIRQNWQETPIPVTFMLVEQEHFNSFAISDPADLFGSGNSLLLDWGVTIPELPASVRNELKLTGVFNNVVVLREALSEPEVYQNAARLKSRRNAPYYAHKLLEQIYGPVPDLGETLKFSAEKLGPEKTMEALVEANLRMQDVLLAYGPSIEAGLKQ